MKSADDFDIVIIGSGAAGGMAALQLTKAGFRALVLETGRGYKPVTEAAMFQMPQSAPLRATSTIDKQSGFFDATSDGGWTIQGEPYSVAPYRSPSNGGGPACLAVAPIIGGGWRSASDRMISSPRHATGWASTGP